MARKRLLSGPPPGRPPTKAQFVAWMANRFFLRFHMTVILTFTFLAGLAVTKVFLELGSTNLALRYGAAVGASYLAFLALLKAWLWYVDDRPGPSDGEDLVDAADAVDLGVDIVSGFSRDSAQGFVSGGGNFGGGGATGSFGEGAASSLLDVGGGDDEGCVLVIVIVVAVVGITASALYLVYAGPTILAEAAFEAILASSLLRGAKKAESPGWVGGAVRATVLPFLAIFTLATGFGWFAQKHCPEARRVTDVLECAGLH